MDVLSKPETEAVEARIRELTASSPEIDVDEAYRKLYPGQPSMWLFRIIFTRLRKQPAGNTVDATADTKPANKKKPAAKPADPVE